jgi:hypothetical protein
MRFHHSSQPILSNVTIHKIYFVERHKNQKEQKKKIKRREENHLSNNEGSSLHFFFCRFFYSIFNSENFCNIQIFLFLFFLVDLHFLFLKKSFILKFKQMKNISRDFAFVILASSQNGYMYIRRRSMLYC